MKDNDLEKMFQALSDDVKGNEVLTKSIIERAHPKVSFTKVLRTFVILLIGALILNKMIFFGLLTWSPNVFDVVTSFYNAPELFDSVSTLYLIEDLSDGLILMSLGFSFMVCTIFPEIVAISTTQTKEGYDE